MDQLRSVTGSLDISVYVLVRKNSGRVEFCLRKGMMDLELVVFPGAMMFY
jgi:hypothetical protein